MRVSVSEFESRFSELLQMVEIGESVTICRDGVPVAEMARAQPLANRGPRKLGTLAGKVVEIDPDWWKAMSDQEADDFVAGKY
jgi:antitoxin (DNA-binding transcriptional repressor) of toxin-antitoxin stability system